MKKRHHLHERVKRFDLWDIVLIKLVVAGIMLFVIQMWPSLALWVGSVPPMAILAGVVVLSVRPLRKYFAHKMF